ncbi:MAG: UvrD-helicase domain-containing protein [Gammaproteobacteria bacterium]|nr:UvrD-helicase domain-containing protein [Gammaproteobacteria bacterium]
MSDQAQRDQALDVTQSYIVQAPAGSGKTELLTQRYLRLLATCSEPENIIAMTFTNKAVDELNERVLSALRSIDQPQPEVPHKQVTYDLAQAAMTRSNERNWQLLKNPKRLKITTIDGLSSLISSRYPSKAQLVPRQIMAAQWQRDHAYKQAAMQTLLLIDDPQHGKAIADLLLYLDNNVEKFYRLVTHMLSKRDQWLMRLYRDGALDADVLKSSAEKIVIQHLSHLEQVAKSHLDQSFFDLMTSSADNAQSQVSKLPGHQLADLAKWQAIESLCLNKTGLWRKKLDKNCGFPVELKVQKNALMEHLQVLSTQDSLRTLLYQVTQLPALDFSKIQADTLAVIAQVLKLCVAQLHLHFEQKQAHDFIEVALNANQALDDRSSISDIALFLDYQLQHLLVDEFQDTSTAQFNSIEKLIKHWQPNDGKTLFLVGDPMQSIYRFRESQVGLFLQVKADGIANIKPESLLLSTNFRSSKSIVEGNNQFFQEIFPTHEDIYQGAIAYSSSKAASSETHHQAITFYPFADDQFAQEAQTVLEIVQSTLSDRPTSKIAILVRSRTHLVEITPLLKQHNIEFESLKITPLKDHLLTRDLFSLAQALMHLGDKLAWLSVLRSPWCGLTLDDILVLSADDSQIIYQQLASESTLAQLSQDGQNRAQHLYSCLRKVLDNQGRFNFVELLTFAIDQLGITRSLSQSDVLIKDQFLSIVNTCEQQQSLNIETIKAALDELYAPSEKANVKLMTIHQSKGLEFDTVIMPGLGRGARSDDSPIMHMKEFSDQSLLLAPIKSSLDIDEGQTYTYLKFVEAQQNKFETMRLLYVAMTRAKRQLHLLGHVSQKQQAAKKSLLALLMPFYQNEFDQIPAPRTQVETLNQAPSLQRLKQVVTPPVKEAELGETLEYQQNFERLFKSLLGTLIHQYYEQGLFDPSADNIKARLLEIGTPLDEINQWRDFVLSLLNNTMDDPQFDWLFKDRSSTLTEAEFVVDNRIIAIDRLFVDDDILWIIDFKTAELLDDESLDQFTRRQQSQHAKQLLFYKETLSSIYDNEIKCALYCPAVSQLIEITH